jgi:hypothetical protein
MISLHIILKRIIKDDFSDKSLVFAHYYIVKFCKLKYIYYLLLLSLAGLPPFLFFFLKSNFIINVMGSVSFYCNLFIFLCYFLNMLFYIQVYLQKNYNFDEIDFLNTQTEAYNYKTINRIICLIFISIFGVIFAPDLFFILNLFFS